MIEADSFLNPAVGAGFDFFTGVPCSFLTPIINRVISDPALDYVAAASEGEAVAIAAGAWLAGRGTVVMCQNSGLGNAVNACSTVASTNNAAIGSADLLQTTAAATGVMTATSGPAATPQAHSWVAVSAALKPASVTPPANAGMWGVHL